MSGDTDLSRATEASFQPDAALYAVISKHGFRPVVWAVSPEEGAAQGEHLAKVFQSLSGPMLPVRFEQPAPDDDADKHAPLFRAIKQSR